jgi:hypothetical protein
MKKPDTWKWLQRSLANAQARLATGRPKAIEVARAVFPKLVAKAPPKVKPVRNPTDRWSASADQSMTASAQEGPRNMTRAVW